MKPAKPSVSNVSLKTAHLIMTIKHAYVRMLSEITQVAILCIICSQLFSKRHIKKKKARRKGMLTVFVCLEPGALKI